MRSEGDAAVEPDGRWPRELATILAVGRWLGNEGINNWALTRGQAFEVLEALESVGLPVLGGDVVVDVGGRIRHTYDNWYLDRAKDQAVAEYVRASIEKARTYVKEYPADEGTVLFVMVPAYEC